MYFNNELKPILFYKINIYFDLKFIFFTLYVYKLL